MLNEATYQDRDGYERNFYKLLKSKLMTRIKLQMQVGPTLKQLAERLDETICLAVLSGDKMLIVDMAGNTQDNEFHPVLGRRYPLPTSNESNYVPAIPASETWQTKGKCLAVSLLMAPLRNGQQEVCGWLCLLGSTTRLVPKRINELLPRLRNEAECLSASLESINVT